MSNQTTQSSNLFVWGGISGIAGTLCYIGAITLPLGVTGGYLLAMAWPVLSIIFVFSIYKFVELEMQSAANQLALIFASLAFTLVAAMISSQLAVGTGIQEYLEEASAGNQETLKLIRRSVRLVDMGIDVAWDIFIGTALLFLAVALKSRSGFGIWWGVPAGLLGLLLIVFNVITFPWPPNTQELVDVGPAIGLYIIALAARLVVLGNRVRKQ